MTVAKRPRRQSDYKQPIKKTIIKEIIVTKTTTKEHDNNVYKYAYPNFYNFRVIINSNFF